MRRIATLILAAAMALPASAQMTGAQRVHEFQNLAALFAQYYAPANWKAEAFGINIFELKPWMERVQAAKTDLEFFDVCAEFVASLRDSHAQYQMESGFLANLGLAIDIVDGKPVVDGIDRTRYPLDRFPIQIGDELLSIDGRPAGEILAELERKTGAGNPGARRRYAALRLTTQVQSLLPRAVELPDQSDVRFLHAATGEAATYRMDWRKLGAPVRQVQPIPTPSFQSAGKSGAEPSYLAPLQMMSNRQYNGADLTVPWADVAENGEQPRVLGFGARNPYYAPPAGFTVRRGTAAADNFFTGTFSAGGKRLGLLRIPHFGPANPLAALRELDAEIAFLKANTDGLIVDVTRNTGGGCIGVDYAQRLIPKEFFGVGERLRPTLWMIRLIGSSLNAARAAGADQWIIDTYEGILNELQASAKESRSLTGTIAQCGTASSPASSLWHQPAKNPDGSLAAYDKPLVVLTDELTVSMGDYFAAILQDATRGPLVGMRTAGAGGFALLFKAGTYSESYARVTGSLGMRTQPVQAPGLPAAPFIENIGVIPDIQLDYMTRENLMTRGRPYMEQVTGILLAEIDKNN